MKTSEFIEKIEGWGLQVDLASDVQSFHYVKNGNNSCVATVSSTCTHIMATDYDDFKKLDDWVQKRLLEILVEYSSTDIGDREPKYFLRLPKDTFHDYNGYLNLCVDTGMFSFDTKDNSVIYKTTFTQEEINDLPNQSLIKLLTKEVVE